MANDDLLIQTSELRAALDALLTTLEESHGATIQVPFDYFWSVGRDGYDAYEPPDLTIGSKDA